MGKIYKIGTKQEFTYTAYNFFKKYIAECWVVRNVKYIYANNQEEAKNKYERWFLKEYKGITKGWRDWYLESDGVDIDMNEKYINITSTTLIIINEDKDINENLETLKENMQAENFKEWWFNKKN